MPAPNRARLLAVGLKVVVGWAMSIVGVLAWPGCAFMNRENTPVTNFVEEKLSPESARAQEALVPVIWPVAAVTLFADAVVVHPVAVVDDAVGDTHDALWDDFDWDEQYATECFKLPWRAAFTPIVFGFDLLGRSLFDIPPHGHREKAQAEAAKALAEASKRFEEGRAMEALNLLDELSAREIRRLPDALQQEFYLLHLRAAQVTGDYAWFSRSGHVHRRNLRRPEVHSALLPVIEEMLADENPFVRLKAFSFTQAWLATKAQQPYVLRQLDDPDPVIRFAALRHPQWLEASEEGRKLSEEVCSGIRRLAATDADPVVRAEAAETLRVYCETTDDP